MAKTEGFNLMENLKDNYDVNDLEMGTLAQSFKAIGWFNFNINRNIYF
jgi:hypothetical protein